MVAGDGLHFMYSDNTQKILRKVLKLGEYIYNETSIKISVKGHQQKKVISYEWYKYNAFKQCDYSMKIK